MSRAIITGGMGGVGQATARQLAAQGFGISLWYHTTPIHEVNGFLATLSGSGHTARAVDLADTDAIVVAVAAEFEATECDVLVHAAVGPLVRKTVFQTTTAQMNESLQRDVLGTFVLLREVGTHFKTNQNGRVFALTTAALEPNAPAAAMSPYLTAKAAVRELARQLAREGVRDNVLVHTIAPGFMATGLQADVPPRWVEMLAEKALAGRLTTPIDVAAYIARLCADTSGATGQNHLIDTGEITDL